MPNIFPASARISPAFTEPGLIITYAQASGAMAALAGGKPMVKIGSDDLAVYINRLDLRTDVIGGQSPASYLPSASLLANYYQTATYLIRTRASWDHHDIAAAANWNVALPAAQDLAMRQGIFQQMRIAEIYGYNPSQGEGLLNTSGATAVTLPPDTFGNDSASTYDNGQMALFWLGQIAALKIRMYQTGGTIKSDIVVVSPQRIFEYFATQNIVQVTSYQRPGAGTATTAEVIKNVTGDNRTQFQWYFDDTLIGQGAGGADAVLLTAPEIELPDVPGINTNVFPELMPNTKAVNLMYVDMAAPMKIPTPTPDGALTEVQELRITSGWCIRPQGITIVSMNF
jgi:hypothetical protein